MKYRSETCLMNLLLLSPQFGGHEREMSCTLCKQSTSKEEEEENPVHATFSEPLVWSLWSHLCVHKCQALPGTWQDCISPLFIAFPRSRHY